jgi:hypothetical protein
MILTGENRTTWRKICPSATSVTTHSTWTDPGLCGEKMANNHLSMAKIPSPLNPERTQCLFPFHFMIYSLLLLELLTRFVNPVFLTSLPKTGLCISFWDDVYFDIFTHDKLSECNK